MEGCVRLTGPLASKGQEGSDGGSVTFMSYNLTGADTYKCQWVKDVAREFNVQFCALQEHFKTVKSTDQWFKKQFSSYENYVIPAYRLPGVDTGRGRGGLVQLSLKSQTVARSRVVVKSPRIQAQVLTFPTCRVLWINTYMPCDPQTQSFNDTELLSTISEIESIVTAASDCEVIWAGDMNYDMSRDNHFTRNVTEALKRLGLTSVWKGQNIDYTHVHTDGVNTSTIDHFMVSHRLLSLIEECGPVHRGDNLSCHSAILLSLRLGELPMRKTTPPPPPRRMPDWDRATEEELACYTSALQLRLQNVQCPDSMLHCRDPLCDNVTHSEKRDAAMLDILMAVVETSYTTLNLKGGAGRGQRREIIPGWSTEVEPHRLNSRACYREWLAAGKPRQGAVHEAKMKSHAQLRYAVQRVK